MLTEDNNPENKLALHKQGALDRLLDRYSRVLVAFSGGVDSSYLLARASACLGRDRVAAVTIVSELSTPNEVGEAAIISTGLGATHLSIELALLKNEEIRRNRPQRCYYCKLLIYRRLLDEARAQGYEAVLDGSNADDLEDYRPGMRALRELEISSPLLEAGLHKQEIRMLAKSMGLASWNRPASPCLATRFAWGEELTPAVLSNVSAAEDYMRQLGVEGDLRVRCHGLLARVEVNAAALEVIVSHRAAIDAMLRELGFQHVTVDLRGFTSGSMSNPLL